MATITYSTATYSFVHHCDKGIKEFDCERLLNIYKRLHKKKCSQCRNNKDIAEGTQRLTDYSMCDGDKVMRMVNGKISLTALTKNNHKKIPRKELNTLGAFDQIREKHLTSELFEFIRKKLNSENEE
jgi:hypothetical protein